MEPASVYILSVMWLSGALVGVVLAWLFIVFPFWMFVHSVIRMVKMWPEKKGNVLNLFMVALVLFTNLVGALVYYFAVYRKSSRCIVTCDCSHAP